MENKSLRRLLKSKIHRATITHADLHYEGSITLCPELLKAADILPYESVAIWNITNGQRFETYAIKGEPNSRDISVNGAAARLVQPGDLIIIATFGFFNVEDAIDYEPTVVFVDKENRIIETRREVPGPLTPLHV